MRAQCCPLVGKELGVDKALYQTNWIYLLKKHLYISSKSWNVDMANFFGKWITKHLYCGQLIKGQFFCVKIKIQIEIGLIFQLM